MTSRIEDDVEIALTILETGWSINFKANFTLGLILETERGAKAAKIIVVDHL